MSADALLGLIMLIVMMRVSGVRSQRVPLPPSDAPLWGCDGHDYFRAADSHARELTDNRSEAAV